MPEFDSSNCLARLRRELKRPTNDAASNNTDDLYELLTEGMRYVQGIMAAHGLDQNAISETATTADSGLTYTITGEPVGQVIARDGPSGITLILGPESDPATDLVWEGTTFRAPDAEPRLFTEGLIVRYTPEHPAMSASVEPTLTPIRGRLAAIYRAAELWMDRGGYRDATVFANKAAKVLFGDPQIPGDIGIIGVRKQAFSRKSGAREWWRGNTHFTYPTS